MRPTLNLLTTAVFALLSRRCLTLASPGDKPTTSALVTEEKSARSTNTCADPSLAKIFYQGFNGASTLHAINLYYEFVYFNTFKGAAFWKDRHPTFRAWRTQQSFTLPLLQLGNSAETEYIYLIGPDAETPPMVSGFNTDIAVVAWVYYSGPVCGSVPLLSAVYASATDHFYTTDADEHNSLVALSGWADTGVVAYVLPLIF